MNPLEPLSPAKVAAFKLAHEIEFTLKVHRLPCLLLIGVPDSQELVRLTGGMEDEGNCRRFRVEANEVLNHYHRAPGFRISPLMALDLAQFHRNTARKLTEKADAEQLPPDSPYRQHAAMHQTWSNELAALAENIQG